jgi:iron complex transport system substrate-binding protein
VAAARAGEAQRPPAGTRIVSIGGPVTEIVFALGKGDRVVAVDTSSLFPAEVTRLPQVGYQRSLSAESVLAHSPDLVIATADAGPPAALDQLRAAGVVVEIVPLAQTIDAAAARIEAVGAALGAGPTASELADRVRRHATLARAGCCAADHRAPRAIVVYSRGGGTVMVAGSDTPAAAMLELAGARNAASGFTGYKSLSPEILVDAAPEVIVVPSRGLASLGGEAGLLALPGVTDTPAGRDERIVAMEDLLLLGFGPRLATAIDELSRRLAPGAGRGPGANP